MKELTHVYVEFSFDQSVHFRLTLYADRTHLPKESWQGRSYIVIEVTLEDSIDNITRDLAYASEATSYIGDEKNALLAKQWLLNCLDNHEGCQSNRRPNW